MMPGHKTGTRDDWQAARTELAQLEAEQARRNEEIYRKRLDLPWVAVDAGRVLGVRASATSSAGRSFTWATAT
jgi:predicted dithiol-disulfide oxidoreductase (DUF899 family)